MMMRRRRSLNISVNQSDQSVWVDAGEKGRQRAMLSLTDMWGEARLGLFGEAQCAGPVAVLRQSDRAVLC